MNRHTSHPRRPRPSESGVALVLTLAIIALLCLMVLGLTSTMKIERDISVSYGEDIQTRRVGEAALARALFCLTSNTPPLTVFAAAPGQIWLVTPTGLLSNGLGLFNQDNRTNERPLLRNALEENNLNWAGLVCGENARYPASSFLQDTNWFTQTLSPPWTTDPYFTPVSFITPGWVTLGTNHQQAGNFGSWTNPIIARFAYWIDAETCKVNLNTAGRRAYTNSFYPPAISAADIDLRALRGAFANNDTLITNFLAKRGTTNWLTHEAIRTADPLLYSPASFKTNKFSTTVYGTTPDRDVFGQARTDLNTLTAANIPAAFTNSRYATEVYPDKTWARNTFQDKYGQFGVRQILANIQGYRGAPTNDTLVAGTDNDGIPGQFSSLREGPLISQFIVHVATNYPAATNLEVNVYCRFKVVNGYDNNISSSFRGEVASESVILTYSDGVTQTNPAVIVTNTFTTGITAHSFADWVLLPLTNSYIPASGTPLVKTVQVKFRRARLLEDATGQPLDWISRQDFTNTLGSAGLTFTNFGSAGSLIAGGALAQSLGKHDPRVRTFPGWEGTTSFAGNQTTLTTNWALYTGAQISTNTDDSCSTNFSSALAPTRFGLLANPRADNGAATPSHRYLDNRVRGTNFTSVGELGYIHTGYPWRTVRLGPVYPLLTNTVTTIPTGTTGWATNVQFTGPQLADFISNGTGPGDPNTANPAIETNAIPDWVLLDMFTAGTPIPSGRININNRMTGPAGTLPSRTDPIGALIWNAESNLNAVAGTTVACLISGTPNTANAYDLIARNIAEGVSSPNSPYAALSAFGDHRIPVYRTPGEVCETIGINYRYMASAAQPSQADRTRLLTRIAPLITTVSDTFTIWAVAEHVEDTDRDGVFDWMYQAQYRYADPHPSFSDTAYTNYILNATNYVTTLVDGDGTADNRQDRVCGRFRIQAVVQRDATDPARPKYRVIFVRHHRE